MAVLILFSCNKLARQRKNYVRVLYIIRANVDSIKDAAGTQKSNYPHPETAPGPPKVIAVATPAKLPVPTRLAMETAKA